MRQSSEPATNGTNGTNRTTVELEQRLEEMESRWRQTAADLQNVKRRYRQDFERERETERRRAAELWLPVVDSLELAMSQAHRDPESIVSGVEATYRQALDVLENLGYPRDAATGVPFDPTRHDVVAVVPDPDLPEGTVVDVIRPGYGTADRQLRPATVTVAKETTDGRD